MEQQLHINGDVNGNVVSRKLFSERAEKRVFLKPVGPFFERAQQHTAKALENTSLGSTVISALDHPNNRSWPEPQPALTHLGQAEQSLRRARNAIAHAQFQEK